MVPPARTVFCFRPSILAVRALCPISWLVQQRTNVKSPVVLRLIWKCTGLNSLHVSRGNGEREIADKGKYRCAKTSPFSA